MARRILDENLRAIEEVVRGRPEGMTARQIAHALESAPPRRTLQYRVRSLVDAKRLVMEGSGRWARYRLPRVIPIGLQFGPATASASFGLSLTLEPSLSTAGTEIREYVSAPVAARKPVGYDRTFLDSYRPNETFYLSPTERAQLREIGAPSMAVQPAGTYATQILNRLLIDLSWNSSRLEGNTYSLLDTSLLIELGEEAEGKDRHEAQMILNHKDAITFLVDAAEDIGRNGPRELDSRVSEIFLGYQAAKSR